MDKNIKIEGADLKISVPSTDIDVPKVEAEVKLPEVEVKDSSEWAVKDDQPGVEFDIKLKKPKFSLPSFSFSKQSVKAPEVDVSLQSVNVAIPEGKVEVKGGEVDLQLPEGEAKVDGERSKFTMPKFGFTMPEVTGPEIDFSLSKKDGNVTLPEAKAEVQILDLEVKKPSAELEIKAPEIKVAKKDTEGSPSKYKFKFKMPTLGLNVPQVKQPDIDLNLSKKDVNVTLPEVKAEVKLPDVKMNEPSAELDIKDPEIKVAMKNTVGSPTKFKMPTFKLPKFGVSMPSATVEVPDTNKDVKIDGGAVRFPEEVLTVAAPNIDIEGPAIDVKSIGTEQEVKGSKFKMPKFGITMPNVTGPEIDLSLSTKNVDLTLPEAKAEVKLPDVELQKPSSEVEFKSPEIKVQTKDKEGSPSKFKMPTFKLPKFGMGSPSAHVELPETDKELKIDGADMKIPEEVLQVVIATPSIDIEGPSIEIKSTGTEHVGKGSKFKMPSLGFNVPQVKRPDIDLSLSKKDVNVTLPEVKAEVKLPDVEMKEPSAEFDIKDPEIKVALKNKEGSPSKYKMPTFKLPKFGVSTPSATVEVPETNKNLKIDGADMSITEDLNINIAAPSIDIEGPSIEMKTSVTEHPEKGSKFKMPKIGVSKPKVKGPDIDINLSKKDVDVTLPEAKAEVKLPEVELQKPSAEVEFKSPEKKLQTKDKEGSPSKFKMPTFKLPKFGVSVPSVTVDMPETNKDLKIDGADMNIPEDLKINIAAPSIDIEGPSIEMKTTGTEHPEKGTKAEVKLPDVELQKPSAEVEFKSPEIKLQTKDKEGSPSKFKMPTFKLPKFGVSMPSATVDMPETNKDLKIDGADMNIPDEDLKINIAAPSIDIEVKKPSAELEIKAPEIKVVKKDTEVSPSKYKLPTFKLPKFGVGMPSAVAEGSSIDMKMTGIEHEGKAGKFKMPKFGITMPKVTGPEIDINLSKKDIDVTLPEAKVEVKLPEVVLQKPSAEVEFKAPEIKVQTKDKEGSPSKFKMPTFKLPKFGIGIPSASVELPETKKDLKIDGADIKISGDVPQVDISAPHIDIEGKGSKFKMPSLGFSGSHKDVDVTLPEAKAKVQLSGVELKESSAKVEMITPQVDVQTSILKDHQQNLKFAKEDPCPPDVEVQVPSGAITTEELPAVETDVNLKKSRFSLPRLSFSKSSIKEPEVSAEIPHVDVSLSEGEVIVTQPQLENITEHETEYDGQGSKFKLPKFGIALPKAKGPQEELNAPQNDVEIKLPEVKVQVKLPKIEVKSASSVDMKASETEAKAKDIGGSPLTLKGPSVEFKTDVETPTTETESQGSPSKFKLPSFKMPRLSFSKPKPEDQSSPVEAECLEEQLEIKIEPKEENKSPKMTLTSIGEMFQNFDVEFQVPKTDTMEGNLENAKEVHKADGLSGKLEEKEKETHIKQDATRSPERTGWFKFPRFGLSSPSEPAKSPEKDKKEKSPEGETVDDTISPTCSVQSSDAFADISSAMTSEHVGLSLSSPTKVTVKYSDPNTATGLGEVHRNIITSTTRTELFSVEPNLPEKITILSSGVSSSSEDTLRLESGKIHVITSNIEATPEAQHAKLLTTVQVQSVGGLPLRSEGKEAASWTVEDSQGGKKTVFERHLVTETSSERSESKETIVITKQITRMLDSAEHISGETASSIQRLRETVHSEKMRFFDEAEK
uniref:Uncharacterized protein n=1 Tax=Labrus bergylta TaxID=56723 RepID=A0A3Q3EM03_9LABR